MPWVSRFVPSTLASPTTAIVPWTRTRVVRNAIERAWLKPSAYRMRWNASFRSRPLPASRKVSQASSPVSSHGLGDGGGGAQRSSSGTQTVIAEGSTPNVRCLVFLRSPPSSS